MDTPMPHHPASPRFGRVLLRRRPFSQMAGMRRLARALAGLLLLAAATACGWIGKENIDYSDQPHNKEARRETIFGGEGINLFGGGEGGKNQADTGGGAISVNAFLWRASLDTVSFLPIANADPYGGTIVTDWYQPPESPTERFKVNVLILSRQLRADALKANVFRQRLHPSGIWIDAPVAANTATDLENTILTRARELRIASAQQ
jgi:hypothetical protein